MDALEFRPSEEAATQDSLRGGVRGGACTSFQRASRDDMRPPTQFPRPSPELGNRAYGSHHVETSEQHLWHHNPAQHEQQKFRCFSPPPGPPPCSHDERAPQYRNVKQDMRQPHHLRDGQRQRAAGPGWAGPGHKQRRNNKGNRQERQNNHAYAESSQQHGYRRQQWQDQGGRNRAVHGRGDWDQYKSHDHQRGRRGADSHRIERSNLRQNMQGDSAQEHNRNAQQRPLKQAAPAAPVSKNPFLSKMKQRPTSRSLTQQDSTELHGLSSDERSDGDALDDEQVDEEHTGGGPEGDPETQEQEAAEAKLAGVDASEAQPSVVCPSAGQHGEQDVVKQTSAQTCDTAEQQAGKQKATSRQHIPLAERIRAVKLGNAQEMAAQNVSHSSAPLASKPQKKRRRKAAATSSAAASQASNPQLNTQPPANAKSKQPKEQNRVSNKRPKSGSGDQAPSSPPPAQAKTKRKRMRPEASDACKAPPEQGEPAKKAATARVEPKKLPVEDLEGQKDSTDSECITIAREVQSTSAMAQPLQWGSPSPKDADPPPGTAPVMSDANIAVSADEKLHRDEEAANTATCSHASEHPQSSAASLLEQWMVQDPPDKSGSLLHTWCTMPAAGASSNSAPQAANASGEQQEGSFDADRPNTDACVAEDTTQSAKPAHAAAPRNDTASGAQKRRFQPVGRGKKRPSIHLAFDTTALSMSGLHSTQTGGHEQQEGLTHSGESEAKAAKPCAPGTPNTTGDATDNGPSCEPQTEANESLIASSGKQDKQPAADAPSASLQQPEAATLNIMLQNLAKHGADGSTASVPTRLLQSMAQCMDKLLQQQVRQEEQPRDVPSCQDKRGGAAEPDALHQRGGGHTANSDLPPASKEDVHAEQCSAAPCGAPDCGAQGPEEVPSHASACGSVPPAEASRHVHVSSAALPEAATCTAQSSRGTGQPSEAEEAQGQGATRACEERGHEDEGKYAEKPAVLMERPRNVEVEQMEWARRQAELEKQRRAAQAERRAQAERNAVVRARAQRQKEQSEMQQKTALCSELQAELGRLVLPGMSLRQALVALGFHPTSGAAGEKAALKQARVFHHPDSSRRRGCTLRQQIMSEEIFKILGSLAS